MPRARLLIAYDGAPFHGFAENPSKDGDDPRTVMGDLRSAIERVARCEVALVGAGRTDAGVHGWGQVVSGDLPEGVDLDEVVRRVNRMCAPSITVREARWASDPQFDARFSAVYRHYRYHVWNHPTANPFVAATAWHVNEPLALPAMRLACDPLIGEHDFSSFCRKPKVSPGYEMPSMSRRVLLARWSEVDSDFGPGLLRFEIRANAFCHQMVRSIVGLLVEVGRGRRNAGDVLTIMRAKDRSAAAQVAPPHGLCLWEVGYPAD